MINNIKVKLLEMLRNSSFIITMIISIFLFTFYQVFFFFISRANNPYINSIILEDEIVSNYISQNGLSVFNVYYANNTFPSNIAFAPFFPVYDNPLSYLSYIMPISFILFTISFFIIESSLISNQYKCGYALLEVTNSKRNSFFISKSIQATILFVIEFITFFIVPLLTFYAIGGNEIKALILMDQVTSEYIIHTPGEILFNTYYIYLLLALVLVIGNHFFNLTIGQKGYGLPLFIFLAILSIACNGLLMNPYTAQKQFITINFSLEIAVSIIALINPLIFFAINKKIRF